VLMFKILVLQALHSLSDEATEFQIKDRLSLQRFLGLGLGGTVADAAGQDQRKRALVSPAHALLRLQAKIGSQ